jgi:uncharacterized protein YecE (DUF72 family)
LVLDASLVACDLFAPLAMATRFHIGAKDLRGSIDAYAKRFDFLEVVMLEAGDKRAVTQTTMRKWRKTVPPHFDFCVVVGPNVAKLKASAALDEELAAAVAAVDTLQARCLMIRTPADVTPGNVWRDRMGRLLERVQRDATRVIWEPRGVWEVGDAALAAKKWGIVLAVDAARDPVPAGPVAYTRLRALGETRSYGASALERVVVAIGPRRDAYVVLETDKALVEAKTLRRIAQGVGKKTGGLGRVIRPRAATVKVRDDEQE